MSSNDSSNGDTQPDSDTPAAADSELKELEKKLIKNLMGNMPMAVAVGTWIAELEAWLAARDRRHELEARKDELYKIRLDGNFLRVKDWIVSRKVKLEKELAALRGTDKRETNEH